MIKEARRVPPTPDGFCPHLSPGEYCQDSLHRVWHFCTPDGTRFAIENTGKTGPEIKNAKDGITLIGIPPYASKGNGPLENRWTLERGVWIQE